MSSVIESSSKTELKDFLKRVVPDGHLVAAWTENGKVKQKPFKSHDLMAEFLLQKSFGKSDVYYATASYKQGWHDVDGKMRLRTGENVNALKAFWVDLDVGEKGYKDQTAALKDLIGFIQKVKLPSPTLVVSSGNGIHAYWTLEEPVPPHEWQPIAVALKEAALELKFNIDPVCTADKARILRPIGTHNYKKEKRATVHLLKVLGHDLSMDQMRGPLRKWIQLDNLPTLGKVVTNFDLGSGVGSTPAISYMQRIVKRCGVMASIASDHGAECDEPLWTAVLQLVRFTQDGADWVHPLSDGHPDYSQRETDIKYKERLSNSAGPTLCKTFAQFLPAACRKCPVNGKIKTPISLGTDTYRLPTDLPYGWRYTENGCAIEKQEKEEGIDENGEPVVFNVWKLAIPYGIQTPQLTKTYEGEHDLMLLVRVTEDEQPQPVHFPANVLLNRNKLVEALGTYGMFLQKEHFEKFMRLMLDWLRKLQDDKQVGTTYSKFGWHIRGDKLEFNLAGALIEADGEVLEGSYMPQHMDTMTLPYIPRGEFKPWQKAAKMVVNNGPEHAIILAAAFAAPLIYFTDVSGVLLSVVSSKSGVGKTTCMRVSQAVWGSPDAGINALDDTQASVAKKMGLLNNLPAYWDELRGQQAMEDFTQFTFKLTQGKERSRLRSDTSVRDVGTWKTMMVVASNDSIASYVGQQAGYTDAGLLRVFECDIEGLRDPASSHDAAKIFGAVRDNYGIAGREYIKYLLANAEIIKPLVEKCSQVISERVISTVDERFWLVTAAVLLAGARLASKAGIIEFDQRALLKHLMLMFYANRGRSSRHSQINDPCNMLMDYLSSHMGERLVVDKLPPGRGGRFRATILAERPRNNLAYQLAVEDKMISIPVSRFKDWAKTNYEALLRDLGKVYMIERQRHNLGAGTDMSTSNRVWCIDIDASHPDFDMMLDGFAQVT